MTQDEEYLEECFATVEMFRKLSGSCNSFERAKIFLRNILKERDEYALLLFQPCGETHHDANRCPYCRENLNGKT